MTVAKAGNEEGLDDSRTQWTTPAVTEIGVAALPISPGGVCTFLPLGDDLTPPLAVHLNAPFYTKRDRAGHDREHPLNTMLLDAAALGDSASDAADGMHPTTAVPSTDSCPIDSLTWRLSLDQQIRR
ncbi:hypothetical protein OG763_03390 [Streptomyces sp. NBC_01230]|uniref:hypothetical protein n=1 Tax=Streptomyces sp. NBC_01230 TaxID=2903784 RepID=UPI002E159B04|nr:hypothetical protein OG763_03390 [Streptomyces sp. NBC_01230]